MTTKEKIVPLSQAEGKSIGGKAKGLTELLKCGLKVPEGFVVVEIEEKEYINDLKNHYEKIGEGKVAVRSSALDEDGVHFSNAGQYSTYLNVEGLTNVQKAVENCIASVTTERVQTYTEQISRSNQKDIAVIVQKMVEPKISGVLFTRDPDQGEENIIINAVKGLGEDLVGGKAESDLYILDKQGKLVKQELMEKNPLLNQQVLKEMVQQALHAEKSLNKPLDMEWAIDKKNHIHWLQARPITTLNQITMNELDTPVRKKDDVYTRCNVGEMLPGAVTPLSLSTFAEAIDIGLKWMYQEVGVYPKTNDDRYICNFYGHLFFNLSHMYKIARSIIGTSKDSFEINIIGRTVPETKIGEPIALWKRIINGIRYVRFMNSYKKSLKKLEFLAENFTIDRTSNSPFELYTEIDKNIEVLYQTYYEHYTVSSHSGGMNGALVGIISGGNSFSDEDLAKTAALLVNISQIESANIVASLEEIAKEIRANIQEIDKFNEKSTEEVLQWIKSQESGKVQELFTKFLNRHGHRCIREAELREKDWKTEPEKLITLLQTLVQSQDKLPSKIQSEYEEKEVEEIHKELELKGLKKYLFNWVYKKAKEGMQNREYSKALSIKVQGEFRKAYYNLATVLEKENILPDYDLLYFLTHEELAKLISKEDTQLVAVAQRRRKILAQQQTLQFPEISFGKPEPIIAEEIEGEIEELQGTPVSRGIVQGKVRIVTSLQEAEKLQPGEIMVAPYTDIGWSPFYSLISGLVTEIGGSLSHGAIVAREYGLPLVSSIPNATKLLKTGQRVLLNGNKGIIKIIKEEK